MIFQCQDFLPMVRYGIQVSVKEYKSFFVKKVVEEDLKYSCCLFYMFFPWIYCNIQYLLHKKHSLVESVGHGRALTQWLTYLRCARWT